jgi:hypothetical protein
MKTLAGLALVAGLACCSDAPSTRIDGSSPDAFARSTEKARRDLPVADRLMFDSAIATMPGRRYADRDPAAAARTAFDGLTAADVVRSERERSTGRIE